MMPGARKNQPSLNTADLESESNICVLVSPGAKKNQQHGTVESKCSIIMPGAKKTSEA